MSLYVCSCGQEVNDRQLPQSIRWSDGHVCHFVLKNEPERVHHPIVALGYQAPDGKIVVTDVLCANFPDMTKDELAKLSWNLHQWSENFRR